MPLNIREELQVSHSPSPNFTSQDSFWKVILKYAGRDATKAYSEIHAPSVIGDNLSQDSFKGVLDNSTVDEEWSRGPPPPENTQVVLDNEKPPLDTIINRLDEVRRFFGSQGTDEELAIS